MALAIVVFGVFVFVAGFMLTEAIHEGLKAVADAIKGAKQGGR